MRVRVIALERSGDCLRVIDQTRLPSDVVYCDLRSLDEIIEAIKRLMVRGAPAIGIAAAYALPIAVADSGKHDVGAVTKFGERLKAARPTAVNLFWAVDRMVSCLAESAPRNREDAVRLLWAEAERIHEEDRRMCENIGKHGAALIGENETILTHCNAGALATGGIGTALGVIYTCHKQGKQIHVYMDETRPLLQGARLTAWELSQEGIAATLICDSVAGMLMRQEKIDRVIVGADRIARNGDTANKIGTYSLAVLAREHGVPFYVAAPSSTFDDNILSGEDIPIEERSPEEVTKGFGSVTAPEGIDVYSPAFDITPNSLITAFITDKGVKPGGRSG